MIQTHAHKRTRTHAGHHTEAWFTPNMLWATTTHACHVPSWRLRPGNAHGNAARHHGLWSELSCLESSLVIPCRARGRSQRIKDEAQGRGAGKHDSADQGGHYDRTATLVARRISDTPAGPKKLDAGACYLRNMVPFQFAVEPNVIGTNLNVSLLLFVISAIFWLYPWFFLSPVL